MKFIKCVNALVNLKVSFGLIFSIDLTIFFKDLLLLELPLFTFESFLTFSTRLKNLIPSCSFITSPKIFPR